MKLSTTVTYQHSIIAPKGKVFSSNNHSLFSRVLGDHTEFKLLENGKVLQFSDINRNYLKDFDELDIKEVFGKLLQNEEA